MIDFAELEEFLTANPERAVVLEWLLCEANFYSNEKFGFHGVEGPTDHEEAMRTHGFSSAEEAFWFRQTIQYASRAQLYGVGEEGSAVPERGRQAMLKMLMTLFDCCACMIRNHGLPPEPGHTSGEVVEWKK